MPTCTWHQTDTSQVTMTATNEFDISMTEVENMFATACTNKPAGRHLHVDVDVAHEDGHQGRARLHVRLDSACKP